MANYTEIQGQNILIVSSDPSNPIEGQIWYNSTTNTLKGYQILAAAWASGGALPSAVFDNAAAGIQTAALNFLGNSPVINTTVSYNGTSWSPAPSLNTSRRLSGGAGTQTSALAFGGIDDPQARLTTTERYNGSSWTSVNSLNTGRATIGGAGASNSSVLAFGGFTALGGANPTTATESWNGSSWTSVNSLNTSRRFLAGAGTQTSALGFGGSNPPPIGATESWNGTSWTTVSSMNTARGALGGAGIQTSALAFGGTTPQTAATESFNGTSWTSVSNMAQARQELAGCGASNSSALAIGGEVTVGVTSTEEWTGAALTTRTITTS
jgi:hypothetical protein